MSSDQITHTNKSFNKSLNPFGTGQCLPTLITFKPYATKNCLNPFGTGQCLPTIKRRIEQILSKSLNPFGTGQCLPTNQIERVASSSSCLNPFGTGQCLPTNVSSVVKLQSLSQSLWNRAVSSDCSGILKPCGTRLTRATSQLFPRLRELGLDLIKYCTIFNILFTYQAVENGRDFTRVFRFY